MAGYLWCFTLSESYNAWRIWLDNTSVIFFGVGICIFKTLQVSLVRNAKACILIIKDYYIRDKAHDELK